MPPEEIIRKLRVEDRLDALKLIQQDLDEQQREMQVHLAELERDFISGRVRRGPDDEHKPT